MSQKCYRENFLQFFFQIPGKSAHALATLRTVAMVEGFPFGTILEIDDVVHTVHCNEFKKHLQKKIELNLDRPKNPLTSPIRVRCIQARAQSSRVAGVGWPVEHCAVAAAEETANARGNLWAKKGGFGEVN